MKDLDAMVSASSELEKWLEGQGVAAAHDWMFALREVLYDLRRFLQAADGVLDSKTSPEETAARLHQVANLFLYEVVPHSSAHFEELDQQLASYLPADETT